MSFISIHAKYVLDKQILLKKKYEKRVATQVLSPGPIGLRTSASGIFLTTRRGKKPFADQKNNYAQQDAEDQSDTVAPD